MTLRELLAKPYWGSPEIALVSGRSLPTARKALKKAQDMCKADGFKLLSDYTVFNKYILLTLGIEIDWLEKTGALDTELEKEKHG